MMPEETQLIIKDAESEQKWVDVLNHYERWRDVERNERIHFALECRIEAIHDSLEMYRQLLSLAPELIDDTYIDDPSTY